MFFEVSQEGLHGKRFPGFLKIACDTLTLSELLFAILRKTDLISSIYN